MIFAWIAGQRPVALGAEPHVVDLVAPVVGRRHVLRARGDPLDRPAELARAPAGQDLLAVDLQLGAEAAAHLGRHDADLLLAEARAGWRGSPARCAGSAWRSTSSACPRATRRRMPRGSIAAARGAVVDDAPLDHDVRVRRAPPRRRRPRATTRTPCCVPYSSWMIGEPSSSACLGIDDDRQRVVLDEDLLGGVERRAYCSVARTRPRPPGRRSRPCRARAASARARGRRPPAGPTPSGTARRGRPCPRP